MYSHLGRDVILAGRAVRVTSTDGDSVVNGRPARYPAATPTAAHFHSSPVRVVVVPSRSRAPSNLPTMRSCPSHVMACSSRPQAEASATKATRAKRSRYETTMRRGAPRTVVSSQLGKPRTRMSTAERAEPARRGRTDGEDTPASRAWLRKDLRLMLTPTPPTCLMLMPTANEFAATEHHPLRPAAPASF